MRTVIHKEEITCDICRKVCDEKDLIKGSSETNSIHISTIEGTVWYGGSFSCNDICKDCHEKIVTALSHIISFNSISS